MGLAGKIAWRERHMDRDFPALAAYGADRSLSTSCYQVTIRPCRGRELALQSSAFLLH
jgi:hypothetical protein